MTAEKIAESIRSQTTTTADVGTDFFLNIQRGVVPGFSAELKFGRNPDIDTGADEDIWDGGGTWVPPTTARVHNVASSSANDTSAGSGARTIKVFGLDANYNRISETVTMNGTSNVATANSYTMIDRMYVLTAGSGAQNAGDIAATAQTDATVTAQISTGNNQTLMAIYQVPAGYTAYMRRWYCGIQNASATDRLDMRLLTKEVGGVYRLRRFVSLQVGGAGFIDQELLPPLQIPEKTIIKIRGTSPSANNTDTNAGFNLILEGGNA